MNLRHWAENLYQKLEKACTESEVVQVPCRYVDTVSDHIKHVLDEITDYVQPYDGSSDGTDSSDESEGCTGELSQNIHDPDPEPDSSDVSEDSSDESEGCTGELSQNIHDPDSEPDSSDVSEDSSDVSEDYMESTVESKPESLESTVESKSLESTVESNLSSMKDEVYEPESSDVSDYMGSTVESKEIYPDVSSSEDLSLPTSCNIKSTSAPGSGLRFPDGTVEGTGEDSNIPEYVNTCDAIKNTEHIEEGSVGPDTTSSTENCMSQETISLLRSLTDEHDEQHDINKVDAPERLSETVTEISDDNYMEDVFTTVDTPTPTRVLMDSFEDVNLNTCWEDADNFELVVAPNHEFKELPEKKELMYAFISKVLAAKRNKKMKNQSTDTEINAQLSNSTGDSDWVLI